MKKTTSVSVFKINVMSSIEAKRKKANAIQTFTAITDDLNLKNDYLRMDRIQDYLYEVWYGAPDYDYAYNYFRETEYPQRPGACTSVYSNGILGRNFDWNYDNQPTFVVRTPDIAGRHKTIGVSGAMKGMTESMAKNREYSTLYRVIPFCIVDGLNDSGVMVSSNVVPSQQGNNTIVRPTGVVRETICSLMLPRFILDNFSTASDAVEYIQESVEVFNPKVLIKLGYEEHFIIADANKAYVLEFHDGGYTVTEKNYITNFYVNDVEFNEDGSVNTPATVEQGKKPSDNNISSYGQGLERYNLVNSRWQEIDGQTDKMSELLNDLKYTKTYSTAQVVAEPFWYTEAVGGANTVDSKPDDFSAIVSAMGEDFLHRKRDGKTWHTVHSSVYNSNAKQLLLYSQEGDHQFSFVL